MNAPYKNAHNATDPAKLLMTATPIRAMQGIQTNIVSKPYSLEFLLAIANITELNYT